MMYPEMHSFFHGMYGTDSQLVYDDRLLHVERQQNGSNLSI